VDSTEDFDQFNIHEFPEAMLWKQTSTQGAYDSSKTSEYNFFECKLHAAQLTIIHRSVKSNF